MFGGEPCCRLGRLRLALLCLFSAVCTGLKRAHVVADFRGFITCGAEGGFRHHLHPALLAVLLFEDLLLCGGDGREPLGEFAGGPLVPVEPVHHMRSDAVHFQHHCDGLPGVVRGIALATAFSVDGKSLFNLIGEAEVVHHKAAGLVTEDSVHAGDGLHETVALQWLVGIHRVQTGRVKAGQPHVPDENDLEGILGILELVRRLPALLLAEDTGLPV